MGRHATTIVSILILGLLAAPGSGLATEWTTDLAVSNGAGQTITLQYGIHPDGTDGVDPALGEVGLPPWPPTAVFEARWLVDGVEGLALDVRDDTQTARTHHLRRQAGSGGYPIVLRWDGSALPPGTFTMQDGFTGTLIPAFDMAQTDSLVIPAAQSYINRIDVTVVPGVLPPGPPVITPAIPDQAIFAGQRFMDLALDDFVADPDDPDQDLSWVLTGSGPPWLTLNPDRTVTIEAPDGWTGTAVFNLEVSDPGNLKDSQDFRLTVNEPGLPAWTLGLTVAGAGGDRESLGVGIHPDATDGIDTGLGEVALPPWPPSDVFDARCELPDGLTHSRLDLRDSAAGPATFHVVWQPGEGGYPVTVSWPVELPLAGWTIRDDLGGTFLPPTDMATITELVVPVELSFITGVVIECDPAVDTTAPVGPDGLVVADWSAWEWVTLDWSAYPCTEEHFAYYEILFDTAAFTDSAAYSWDWSEDAALQNIGTTSTTVLLPGPATGYVFRIRAWDLFGNPGPVSDYCHVGAVSAVERAPVPGAAVQASGFYPNPFNPRTEITVELLQDSNLAVEIYDARGALVRTLAGGSRPAGTHRLEWDGRTDGGGRAASGSYFCRIEAGGQALIRKMTLLK